MGKRAPKAETKKQEKKVEEEKNTEEAHFEVFTPKFYETLDSFKNFYKQVLSLKAKEQGTDLSEEFQQVSKRVSEKLEEESNKILQQELGDIENWIEGQQEILAESAGKIEQVYKANASALSSTGSFSDEEIRQQLLPVQAKIDEKKATYTSYGVLLNRSKEVYQ